MSLVLVRCLVVYMGSFLTNVHAGTSKGFRLYNTEPFSKQSESREGDVSILEMLFSTSLVALTLSPRVLRIQNTKVGVV